MEIQELYVDTHVPVWLYAQGLQGFSRQAVQCLESAHNLLISPMAVLEIEYLYDIGKITQSAAVIVHFLSQRIGLSVCTKPFPLVITQALEIKWTRDPFDRLITAQASLDLSCLLTKDQIIYNNYKHTLW
ncbi:MAG: type II toxin-antitoxin system VapC family toxin [Desulfohalobiaceae bacterium]